MRVCCWTTPRSRPRAALRTHTLRGTLFSLDARWQVLYTRDSVLFFGTYPWRSDPSDGFSR